MFLTAHATAGVIIAQYVPNPLVAFVVGFLSHYLLDAVPHGDDELVDHLDEKTRINVLAKMAIIDFTIATGWIGFLVSQNKVQPNAAMLAAVAGSMLPDFLNGAYIVTKNKLIKWNHIINCWAHQALIKKPLPAWQGFMIQAIFFITAGSFLLLHF